MSDSDPEKRSALISELKELDCCSRCILKFIGNFGFQSSEALIDTYLNPKEKLDWLENDVKQTNKKIKRNICSACLGILENSTIQQFVSNMPMEDIDYYKSNEFITLVSLPKCVVLRSYSIYLHIKQKFPDIVQDPLGNNDCFVKRIFRIASSEFIAHKLNKMYKPSANLFIEFEIMYEDDEKELEEFKKTRKLLNVSRTNIEEFLKNCTYEKFKKSFSIPPSPPDKQPTCKIKYKSAPLFLGGRYLKFSREMGQTPFVVNEKSITEYSVEGEIFKSIRKVLKFTGNMIFSASGREDCDTRMLGDGRPFYIQIDNPGCYDITFEQFREIEEDILSTKLCAVLKLQIVSGNDLRQIKDGEQHKKKHYRALCHTTHPDVNHVINVINGYKDQVLEIAQLTPIRVLHRRTISTRPRSIYSMMASAVTGFPKLFTLDLITQAGTYVKEFVNSDFSRTTPNITQLINYPTDVVALDVMKIELEWPLNV